MAGCVGEISTLHYTYCGYTYYGYTYYDYTYYGYTYYGCAYYDAWAPPVHRVAPHGHRMGTACTEP